MIIYKILRKLGLLKPCLVQKPFKYPCDGALYFTEKDNVQASVISDMTISGRFYLNVQFYSENLKKCGTGYFNGSDGKELECYGDRRLIMFVLE